MLIKNFAFVREQLSTHLVEYLESKGRETEKNFTCLDPKHEDKDPSCSILPDKSACYCHSCGRRFDIFDAVSLLENKEITGISFVVEIVQYLCAKYNVLIEMSELSEEKTFELMVYKAYRDAADYIISCSTSDKRITKELNRRGWKPQTLIETLTGTVESFDKFKEYLNNKGYNNEFLHETDLDRTDIFCSTNIIFTTCDEHGNPVGFAARNLLWEKGNPDSGQKYVNQRTTGIRVNIFQKGKRLYGFNLAHKEDKPIYIFEGQPSVLTARQAGLTNCCAIGSTALSTDHIMLLKEFNKYNIVLCLDGDKAGIEKTIKLLDSRFAGHKDMRVQIILLPDDMDPDDFIRANGIAEFHKLAKRSAFEWRLQNFTEGHDPIEVCKSMIPYIINESSYLVQEDMAKILSHVTGYNQNTIQHEVERMQNLHEERKSAERINIIERALHDAKENPGDAEILLTEAKNRLFEISKKYDDDTMSEEEVLQYVVAQRSAEEQKSDQFSGFILSSDMQNFQSVLSGEWDRDVLIVIGGKENTGKSAMCCKLAVDIATNNENVCVLLHTIDDSRQQVLPRFVTIAEGSKLLTLNAVKDPNYWAKQDPEMGHRRQTGYASLETLIKHGRLVVKDSQHGTSLAYVETLLQYYHERYPHRKIVYFLDNFHKLSDYVDQKDERVRFKKLSNAIKALATTYHIPVIATMEYTKLMKGVRPTNHNISETVAMSYDANLIVHLYNDMHELGPESSIFHTVVDKEGKIQRLPRVEMIFGKNKITSFKDSLYFDFFPASSDFRGIERDVIAEQIEKAKHEKDAKMNKENKSDPTNAGGLTQEI